METSSKFNHLEICTPEGIQFSLRLATPVSRMLACVVDLFVISAAESILGAVFGLLSLLTWEVAYAFSIVAYFVISIGYSMLFEWCWRGQTIGKKLLRLRVVDERGLKLKASQIVLRNLLRFIDMLPFFYLLGGVACVISRRAQRIGDIAASTIVVRHPRIREPAIEQLGQDKYNSFKDHPHLESRLRQLVSPQQAGVALQALLRREDFDPTARIQLFHELADYFQNLVPFPEELTEGISDEQYVRNVVDSLYRKATSAS